ncbi:MAG TPA: gliding motility-associated C-terminal domain-containing protein, partial [Bacteroidia bacterium]|nr:gliding motility-associated C-terminal domain-containing protein [Bacteroidia bacterium]
IPVLNALMANPTFRQWYVNRFADLLNTSFSCDSMTTLLDTLIGRITPEMPAQCARWGGNMATWQSNVTTMRTYIQTRCTAIQTGMLGCYNLTGPYNVTLEVQPVGAGTIDCNSLHLDQFPWNAQYFGGIPIILMTAPTAPQYTFDHWELTSTATPSTTVDSININLTGPDHIIAVYKETEILSNVFIPTAFSPNGDGQNDMLFIHGLAPNLAAEIVIFNRWGQQVFETKDMSWGWDGMSGGQPCPSGVYAYYLKATNPDGSSAIKSGNITLMR